MTKYAPQHRKNASKKTKKKENTGNGRVFPDVMSGTESNRTMKAMYGRTRHTKNLKKDKEWEKGRKGS